MKFLNSFIIIALLFLMTACQNISLDYYKRMDSNGFIIELTPSGKIVWSSFDLINPGGFNKTKNGDRIYSDNYTTTFYRVSENGKIKWMYPSICSVYLEETDEGNILFNSDWGNQGLIEVDRFGNTIWQQKTIGGEREVHKIAPDQYLVVNPEKESIAIFDKDHQVFFELKGKFSPYSIQPLEGNHYLITDKKLRKVLEIDLKGNVYWEFEYNNETPNQARYADNRYIISYDNETVLIVDRDKNILNKYEKLAINTISLTPDKHFGLAGVYKTSEDKIKEQFESGLSNTTK
jgi:hypothetical protein